MIDVNKLDDFVKAAGFAAPERIWLVAMAFNEVGWNESPDPNDDDEPSVGYVRVDTVADQADRIADLTARLAAAEAERDAAVASRDALVDWLRSRGDCQSADDEIAAWLQLQEGTSNE